MPPKNKPLSAKQESPVGEKEAFSGGEIMS